MLLSDGRTLTVQQLIDLLLTIPENLRHGLVFLDNGFSPSCTIGLELDEQGLDIWDDWFGSEVEEDA